MPLIKPEALPIPLADVEAVAARLTEPYASEVVRHDTRRCLFVRSPTLDPDPVLDLEAALEAMPGQAPADVTDVVLLGTRRSLHVPGTIAQRLLDARARLDHALAETARAQVDPNHGALVHRHAGDRLNVERLLLRLPHPRCADLTEADLLRLAERVGPLFDDGQLRHVQTCHIVADEDHVRLRGDDALADLIERWASIKARRLHEAAQAAAQDEAPAPEPADVPAAMELLDLPLELPEAPPPAPRRVEDLDVVIDVEYLVDALPPTPPPDARSEAVERDLVRVLGDAGYRVRRAPFLDPDSPFTVEAERTVQFPHRVAVLRYDHLDRAAADRAARLARARDADLVYALCNRADVDARRRLVTTKVKVITPEQVDLIRP